MEIEYMRTINTQIDELRSIDTERIGAGPNPPFQLTWDINLLTKLRH